MFVGIGMGVTAGRGGDDAGLSGADGLNFQRDRYRLNGVNYASLMAVPGVTYSRAGTATAWRADGTLAEFAPNVPRITDKGVLIEGQRTNLDPWSRNNPGWVAAGTTPPSVNGDVTEDGRRCVSVTFPAVDDGYAVSRAQASGNGAQIQKNKTYVWSVDVKLSRPLVVGESIIIYYTGTAGLYPKYINEFNYHVGWKRVVSEPAVAADGPGYVSMSPFAVKLLSPLTVFLTNRQLEEASDASSPIITTGAPATRGMDDFYVGGLQQLFASPYSVVVECEEPPPSGARSLFAVSQGGLTNRVILYRNGPNYMLLVNAGGGGSVVHVTAAVAGSIKAAMSFDGRRYRAAVNGVLFGGDGPTAPFTAPLERIYPFGSAFGGDLPAVPGRSLALMPYALTDAQLQAMTQ